MSKGMIDKRGFSLLELMMVVVIIAIMAAVALPNMSGWFSKKDLDAAARELFTAYQQARLQAIKGSEEVRISFDTSTTPNSYIVRATTTGVVIGPVSLPDGSISFEAPAFVGPYGSTTTGFNSRGLSLQSGTITIVSSDAPPANNKRMITLTVGGNATIAP